MSSVFKYGKWKTWGIKRGQHIPKVNPSDVCRSWKIWTGDKVEVISGEYKGSTGDIFRILRDRNLVLIRGVNVIERRVKMEGQKEPEIVRSEKGIHISNVRLLDKDSKPVRVTLREGKYRELDADGKETGRRFTWGRYTADGTRIDWPSPPLRDRSATNAQRDTDAKTVLAVSFVPSFVKKNEIFPADYIP